MRRWFRRRRRPRYDDIATFTLLDGEGRPLFGPVTALEMHLLAKLSGNVGLVEGRREQR